MVEVHWYKHHPHRGHYLTLRHSPPPCYKLYIITKLNTWRLPFYVSIWNRSFAKMFLPPGLPFCFFWLLPVQWHVCSRDFPYSCLAVTWVSLDGTEFNWNIMCPWHISNLSTKLNWLLSIGGTGWTLLHTSLSFHTLHTINLMLGKELCGLTTLTPPPVCGHHLIKVELKIWKAHVRAHWKLRHEVSELCAHLRAQVRMVLCTTRWLKFLDRTYSPYMAVAWRCSTHNHFAITF